MLLTVTVRVSALAEIGLSYEQYSCQQGAMNLGSARAVELYRHCR
jgi:hypothetical protein